MDAPFEGVLCWRAPGVLLASQGLNKPSSRAELRAEVHPHHGNAAPVTPLRFMSRFGREGQRRRRTGWGLSSLQLETQRINKLALSRGERPLLEGGTVIYGRGDDSRGTVCRWQQRRAGR